MYDKMMHPTAKVP